MGMQNNFSETMPTKAHVYLGNKKINFVSLRLEQAFGEHHKFSVKADFDTLGEEFMNNPLNHLNLIGKTIDIEIQQGDDNASAYMFRGMVQNVALEGEEGKHGYLVLNGTSPTILLERGKRYDIFTNLNLQQVFEQVADEIINQKEHLPYVNAPIYNGQTEFLMQYNESDWEFLRRLSAISGENLYYTGRDLVFGAHKEFPTMEATYDKEITSFQFGNRYLPNNFTRYQYLADRDDTLTQDAPPRIKDANNYVNAAADGAKELTEKRPVRTPVSLPVQDVGALNELVEREKVTNASQTVYVKGTAKTCDPRIGRLLNIKMPSTMPGASDLGTYRITKVVHNFEQNDRYTCEFEGIPADLKFYPTPEANMPTAQSIRTTVISNEDPQGQGRVRVDFPFASDRVSDVWLRVMTPNAGSSNEVAKNRGLVFIPEKDDQVMVGFEFGDPNRPYVMGSLFHGRNSEGGGAKNHIKSIITNSGHTIEFDDDKSTLGITIKDINGNVIHLDTKGKNIEITAPETIILSAKNIKLEAEENVEIVAKKDILSSAESMKDNVSQSILQLAKNMDVAIDEKYTTLAKEIKLAGDVVDIYSQKENMTLYSKKNVETKSGSKKIKLS